MTATERMIAVGSVPDVAAPEPSRVLRAGILSSSRRAAGLLGAVASVSAVVAIWLARATFTHWVYVSELGAVGAPTARVFAAALLAIAFGGWAIAYAAWPLRSRSRVLRTWPPAATIGASALCFVVASQVTCTSTCPVPFVNPDARPQDLVHIVFAVLGFALGCYAMLQCVFVRGHVAVLRMSLVACCAVAVVTIIGGVLAIAHVAVDFGAAAEYAGMTIAIGWLATLGVSLGLRPRRAAQARPELSNATS